MRLHSTASTTWQAALALAFLLVIAPAIADTTLIRPALQSDKASSSLLLDITEAGERLVAVGERGHIIWRDPEADWQQAEVPVIAHLTGVAFPTPQLGFAVGHEGIILRTEDAGESWSLVHHELVEGPRRAAEKIPQLEAALEEAEDVGDLVDIERLELQLDDLYFLAEADEVPPLLAVHFVSSQLGFAVGGYNLFLATEDGGDTWEDRSSALPNPDELHNNAITRDPVGRLFIAGERGRVYRSEDQGLSWDDVSPDYQGSLFGLFATRDGLLVATGLRGHLFISRNAGESWEQPDNLAEQTLNAGLMTEKGQLLIVGQNGEYLLGTSDRLTRSTLPGRHSLQALASQAGEYIAVGRGGIHPLPLEGSQK